MRVEELDTTTGEFRLVTKWPDKHLDPAEVQLFAFAALRALDGAVFDVGRIGAGVVVTRREARVDRTMAR